MPSVDRESSGLPMPYGIDVAPDGRVWFARLYANDIGYIDPPSGELTMIDVTVNGPRRLRVDGDNMVWMVAFQDGLVAKYDPDSGVLSKYPLPLRSEIPYALNVDRQRRAVWVNGNQSDTILRFDIDTETWQVYPMSRQRTFTRDIEIAEDGSVFTSNSHFPSWQIEDAQPTLIHIQPYSQ
jgi:virginiamycin B lyase